MVEASRNEQLFGEFDREHIYGGAVGYTNNCVLEPGHRMRVSQEEVGIHVLLTRSLFGDGIPRRFSPLVSLAKSTSPLLRF